MKCIDKLRRVLRVLTTLRREKGPRNINCYKSTKLVSFVWNFTHANYETNQQELAERNREKYKSTAVILAFKNTPLKIRCMKFPTQHIRFDRSFSTSVSKTTSFCSAKNSLTNFYCSISVFSCYILTEWCFAQWCKSCPVVEYCSHNRDVSITSISGGIKEVSNNWVKK